MDVSKLFLEQIRVEDWVLLFLFICHELVGVEFANLAVDRQGAHSLLVFDL